MSGILKRCTCKVHAPCVPVFPSDEKCPECTKWLIQATKKDIMDAYRELNSEQRWDLAMIYHSFPERDPLLDWVAHVKKRYPGFTGVSR